MSGMYVKLPENMFVFSKTFKSYVSLIDCITKTAPEDKELNKHNSYYEKLTPVQRELLHPTPKKYKLHNEEGKESTQEQDIEEDDTSENESTDMESTDTESTDRESTNTDFSDTDNYYPEFY